MIFSASILENIYFVCLIVLSSGKMDRRAKRNLVDTHLNFGVYVKILWMFVDVKYYKHCNFLELGS